MPTQTQIYTKKAQVFVTEESVALDTYKTQSAAEGFLADELLDAPEGLIRTAGVLGGLHAAGVGIQNIEPGDIGSEVETLLARGNSPLVSEALVLSHHGSRDGSTQGFLARVAAGLAVVSCGKRNPFGHPSEEVLDRLARRGIELYRTDAGGMIQLDETVGGWEVRRPGSE